MQEEQNEGRGATALALLVFAVASLAPFFLPCARGGFQYLGTADYLSAVDIALKLKYSIFPFNHFSIAGTDQSFLIATIPLYLFLYLGHLAGLSPLNSTLAFLSLLLFIAQTSFYFSAGYLLRTRLELRDVPLALLVSVSVIYGFSPYGVALFIPGHIVTIIVYAFFPLIIKCLDMVLTGARADKRALMGAFAIFLVSAPGFANIGIIYVLGIACGLYALSFMVVNRLDLAFVTRRFCLFISLIFLANAWWLLPHLNNLRHVVAMNQSSAVSITAGVRIASSYASILNIFLGRPQGMLYMRDIVGHDLYVSGAAVLIFAILSVLAVAAIYQRKRHVFVLLGAMLLSVFLVKGPQPPFSDIFMWAYTHVPGFQIFRRPDSKFYGFFLFFYLALAACGCSMLFRAYAKRKVAVLMMYAGGALAAAYLVVVFSVTNVLRPFNIPSVYSRAGEYLLRDGVTRLLVLPSTWGMVPVYTPDVNSYTGLDFIYEVFRFPVISPDRSSNSNNEAYKAPANDLMQLIREGEPICEASSRLGISHIMVREDLDPAQPVEDKAIDLVVLLDKHPDIVRKTVFGANRGFHVYKLKEACKSGLITVRKDGVGMPSISFSVVNPGSIILHFSGIRERVGLDFLANYNEGWQLLPYIGTPHVDCSAYGFEASPADSGCGARPMFGEDLKSLFSSPLAGVPHTVSYGYANHWDIDVARLREALPPNYFHSGEDGAVDFDLLLHYRPQGYVALGALLTSLSFIFLGAIWMWRP